MDDHELLELAAKAAGMVYHYASLKKHAGNIEHAHYAEGVKWNPLADDGDALRLAIKLELCIDGGLISVYRTARNVNDAIYEVGTKYTDPYKTTRRLIVQAAAQIGRAM